LKATLCITAVALAIAVPAYALEQPKPGKADGRIRFIDYNPHQVVELWTQPGAIMEVQFAADESVPEGNVARTDGSKVDAKPRANLLYIKLRGCIDPEPLLVTTKLPNGQLRPYRFQIETKGSDCSETPHPNPALPQITDGAPQPLPHHGNLKYVPEGGLAAGSDVMYSVVFKYPADEAAKRAAAAKLRQAEQEKEDAARLLKQQTEWPFGNAFDGSWSFKYAAQGDAGLAPRTVRDNGYQTVFIFPSMQRVPALFRINPDGTEATVNFSAHRGGSDGDTIIADGTALEWRLRDGKTVLNIRSLSYSPAGATPATGTVSPLVERTLKGEPDGR
jgi:type IV secretion system protein VirB9